MNKNPSSYPWFHLVLAACVLALGLAGCADDGNPGAAGAPGPGVAPLATSTALNITITGASISSPPVVNFSVTNQDGVAVSGFAQTDLRFNIAKLIPGSPSKWQNYINRVRSGAVQGNQERSSTGNSWGTLVDHKDGTFTYTFATDITNPAANPCPAPCTDADGNALDISYQPSLTHRISIQQGNSALPKASGIYDFVPAGGAVTTTRDIVSTAKCNECHNQLVAHGTRIETKLCVTCHNPGSWDNSVVGNTQPVDFKVFIHKLHHGDELPSVLDPDGNPATTTKGTYAIGTSDFSDVAFPQDIRNCTKCHDGTAGAANATANGNNWKTMPSKAACASCHDDVYFGASPAKPYQVVSHMNLITTAGGIAVADPADSLCISCHASGQLAGSIEEKHAFPALVKAEAAKYVLKIVSVTSTTPGLAPVIKFQINNASGTPYDIAATPAITGGSMSLLVGWDTTDMKNTTASVGRSNAQPISISLLSGGALVAGVTNNGDGTYSITSTTAIPADATGTGRVGFYGRMSVNVDGVAGNEQIPVKSVVKDFVITGTLTARRTAVDIAKCDKCHSQLTLHGNARTDEPQLCVMCHNPNATDTARRPAGAPTGTLDNKKEEAIDFKTMIHGIHAAGMRENGLVVYGFFSAPATENPVDFRGLRFPGILNDCATCHTTPTTTNPSYSLSGIWETPTENGILGTTIDHGADLTIASDDLNISPTAAVCSSCHDGALAKQHMSYTGGATFSALQSDITSHAAGYETCAICHGPGAVADVKVVHGVQ